MPFIGGPPVRVTPNSKIEIRWIADFVGDGLVAIFDNPNGSGTPIYVKSTPSPSLDHTMENNVGGILVSNTTYYFKVKHVDPTGLRPDTTNEPPPFPPFFTGAQAIGSVFADVDVNSAVVSWTANVIGLGRVDYGTASPNEFATTDAFNITDHSIALTGLLPGTTYQFRVSNRHAIDGDSLAEKLASARCKRSADYGTLIQIFRTIINWSSFQ